MSFLRRTLAQGISLWVCKPRNRARECAGKFDLAVECGQLTDDDRAKLSRAHAKLEERPLYVFGTREVKGCDLEKLGAVARGLSWNVALRLIVVDDLMELKPRQLWTETRTRAER